MGNKDIPTVIIILIYYYRIFLGLLKTADGDKIVEDPVIESFYKVLGTLRLSYSH